MNMQEDEEMLVELREEEEPASDPQRGEMVHIPIGTRETPVGPEEIFAILSTAKVPALQKSLEQLSRYMTQMGQLINTMQRKMDELEARQAAVTIGHRDVLQLMARIRWKAGEVCGKYNLQDPDSQKIFRTAIKKDLLKRYQVKDLHDLPAATLPAAEKQIDSWTDIRLVMERRVRT